MEKCLNFGHFPVPVKPRFFPLVLFEGVMLVDQEFSLRMQGPESFRENKGEIFNVLEDKIANDQIRRLVFAWPFPCEVGHGEFDMPSPYLVARLRDHSLGKIKSMDAFTNLCKEGSI